MSHVLVSFGFENIIRLCAVDVTAFAMICTTSKHRLSSLIIPSYYDADATDCQSGKVDRINSSKEIDMSLASSSRFRAVIELRLGKARSIGTCPTRSSDVADVAGGIASTTGRPQALANSARTVAELVPADRCGSVAICQHKVEGSALRQ